MRDYGDNAANKNWPARFWERPAQDVWEILKKAPLKAPMTLTTMVLPGKHQRGAADAGRGAGPTGPRVEGPRGPASPKQDCPGMVSNGALPNVLRTQG